MSSPERDEQRRLETCQARIDESLKAVNARLRAYAAEVRATTDHMGEARRDMDHLEKASLRELIDQKNRSAAVLREQQVKLLKLKKSPYFGRVDFAREAAGESGARTREAAEQPGARPIYVGVHDFQDESRSETLVHDWRAPIASMFYDYEIGPARYLAPSGEIRGRLELKRQFRIRDGRMELMLESGLNIVDDVLQDELGRTSDEGMKTIVATIQRDQNAIIRDADAQTLIIQGVAGSGKTSIALHRIAFLLYRFKDQLSSKDILIISPNRVFADYIGNVLPELGEEQVSEIGMEALADELLEGKYRFQTFFEQTARLLETDDAALKARIAAKSTMAFLERIDAYVEHLEAASFQATDWRTGLSLVPDWHFAENWKKYKSLLPKERIDQLVRVSEHQFYIHYKRELEPEERRDLRKSIRAMVRQTTLRAAYKGLYDWLGEPELFKPAGGKLEYADVFPLIYLKLRLEGVDNPRKAVKHLLIDEMQDYSPLHYAVLGKLFDCRKTILGDAAQSVNPEAGSTAADIRRVLKAAPPVKLTKSYRSSLEIMRFALAIAPNAELEPIERHGPAPEVVLCRGASEVTARIKAEVEAFEASPHRTLAIIAKTQKQAATLHRRLTAAGVKARLLDAESSGFSTGSIVCTAHLAKGLEFDRVIVPDASAHTLRTEMDRNLLYIACTRAMHQLTVISDGEPSSLLPKAA